MTLNSNNPFDPPLINPNFLSSDFDIFVMREAIRSARRFLTAPVWADYVISPTNNATTDAELNEYIRGNTGSVFHPVGTSSMSPRGARYGVVDPDLRVKGVVGVRVVDASVLVRFLPTLLNRPGRLMRFAFGVASGPCRSYTGSNLRFRRESCGPYQSFVVGIIKDSQTFCVNIGLNPFCGLSLRL